MMEECGHEDMMSRGYTKVLLMLTLGRVHINLGNGPFVHLLKKVYLLILFGSGPPPPTSSRPVKSVPRGSRLTVVFMFPFPLFPL